jgi:hypothetical protein
MVDYFLNFLNARGDLNYVLAGYFAKIFGHMLNHKNITFIRYIFTQRFEVIDDLLINSNRKSISECLLKILHSPVEEIKSGIQIKLEIIDKIITFIGKDNDDERVENLVNILIELLNSKNFSVIFLKNLNLFKKIHEITCSFLKSANNIIYSNIYKDLLHILIKLNENILRDFGPTAITPQQYKEPDFLNYNENMDEMMEQQGGLQVEIFDLKKNIEVIVDIITESGVKIAKDYASQTYVVNSLKDFASTYNKEQKVLGVRKLNEFEYLNTSFEILLNAYAMEFCNFGDKIENFFEFLINSKFFQISLQNFYRYEFNNFYQKSFEHFMLLICNKHTPSRLIRHIFETRIDNPDEERDCEFIHCDFLQIILEKCEHDLEFSFE